MGQAPDVRISLLGLGRAGGFHLASIRALPGVELVQVHDTDPERAAEVAAAHGCRRAASPAEATGATDIDAVVVATPTQSHFGYVEAALDAGKPVLSEKPLGTTVAEIDRCFGLAEARDVPLLVAFQRRFDASFAAVAAAAHAGEVGGLQFIRSVSRDSPVPSLAYLETSGGIFHDCVVHDFDLVCWVAGEAPEEVFAYGSNFAPGVREIGDLDNVVVSLRFPSGLLASIDASRQGPHGYDQRLEVLGLEGMVESRNWPQNTAEVSTAAGSRRAPIDYSFPTRYAEAYRNEFVCFLDCVRGDRTPPITHADVRLNHRVADAAALSARTGKPIRLDEVEG
ncbi:MAG: Gfo/Idh/MocA family oxidoreductase [Deltaproteobacteria bacterium]|nr:Gfo/Idh/MocA family oxidoreductase [Deltaproteobacteria bacterium]